MPNHSIFPQTFSITSSLIPNYQVKPVWPSLPNSSTNYTAQCLEPIGYVFRVCHVIKGNDTPLTEAYYHRMTFLTQLENHHWASCGRCQKLNPREEFLWGELNLRAPSKWTCMSCAGIVDLCPCIALTARDRKHIVEYPRSRNKRKLELMSKGLLEDSQNDMNELSLLHECNA